MMRAEKIREMTLVAARPGADSITAIRAGGIGTIGSS
jgi:hypothetical protein